MAVAAALGLAYVVASSTGTNRSTVAAAAIREPSKRPYALRAVLSCDDAKRAVTYYRHAYAAHRAVQRLSGPVPRVWYRDCDTVRRRAADWRDRAKAERERAAAWREYHFDWHKWLPWNWRNLGSCETGYGGDPNFAHSVPGFVSAFGITRTNYAIDARWAGGPQWSDDPAKRPTPRQQYQAALAHYEHHGDGWGCPGP